MLSCGWVRCVHTPIQGSGDMEGEGNLVGEERCARPTSGLARPVAHISSHQSWLPDQDQVSQYPSTNRGRSCQQLTVSEGGEVILLWEHGCW